VPAKETPARLNRGTDCLSAMWVSALSSRSYGYYDNKSIQFCMALAFLAYKYCNPFPISFSPFLHTHPTIPTGQTLPVRVTPAAVTCSLQRPVVSQRCASPSRWKMKRRGPPRSTTLLRIIKVMPWFVIFFLSPSNWKKVVDIPGRAHSGHHCGR
jgi:hypothetical protein